MRLLSFLTIGLVCVMSGFGMSQAYANDLEDSLQAFYENLPEESRAFLDEKVMNPIKADFDFINNVSYWGDPEFDWDEDEDGKLVRFKRIYKRLLVELNHQDQEPFVSYNEMEKVRHSLQRMVMFQISTETDSAFYGIHDMVWDELYADSSEAAPSFEQLSYEPLIDRIPGMEQFKPVLGVIGAMVTLNLLQQGETGTLIAGGVLAVVLTAFLGESFIAPFIHRGRVGGGSPSDPSPGDDDDEAQQWLNILMQVAMIWSSIQETHDAFRDQVETLMPNLRETIEEASDLDISEESVREMVMSLNIALMNQLSEFMMERQNEGIHEDLFAELQEFMQSIDVMQLVDGFVENTQSYVTDEQLRDFLAHAGRDLTGLRVLIGTAQIAYYYILGQVYQLIQSVQALFSENGQQFDEQEFYVRYLESIQDYKERRLPAYAQGN